MTNIVAGDKSKPRRYPRQKESGVENIAKDLNDHFFNNPEAGDTWRALLTGGLQGKGVQMRSL